MTKSAILDRLQPILKAIRNRPALADTCDLLVDLMIDLGLDAKRDDFDGPSVEWWDQVLAVAAVG
jgi:hypothetical protein